MMTLEEKSFEIKEKIRLGLKEEKERREALCFADTLAALCSGVMRLRAEGQDLPDRDRLIVSGGAAEWACRAAGLRADAAAAAPGESVELAVDMALKARAEIKIYRSFALISQADCLSGKLWENAIRASENMLEDLTVILCRETGEILPGADNICAKFSAFGFDTLSADGAEPNAVALSLLLPRRSHKPLFVCCDVK